MKVDPSYGSLAQSLDNLEQRIQKSLQYSDNLLRKATDIDTSRYAPVGSLLLPQLSSAYAKGPTQTDSHLFQHTAAYDLQTGYPDTTAYDLQKSYPDSLQSKLSSARSSTLGSLGSPGTLNQSLNNGVHEDPASATDVAYKRSFSTRQTSFSGTEDSGAYSMNGSPNMGTPCKVNQTPIMPSTTPTYSSATRARPVDMLTYFSSAPQDSIVADSLEASPDMTDGGFGVGEPTDSLDTVDVGVNVTTPRRDMASQTSLPRRPKQSSTNFIERNIQNAGRKASKGSYVQIAGKKEEKKNSVHTQDAHGVTDFCTCEDEKEEIEQDNYEDTQGDNEDPPPGKDQGANIQHEPAEDQKQMEELSPSEYYAASINPPVGVVSHQTTPPEQERSTPYMQPISHGSRHVSHTSLPSYHFSYPMYSDPYFGLPSVRSDPGYYAEPPHREEFPLLNPYEYPKRSSSNPNFLANNVGYPLLNQYQYSYQLPPLRQAFAYGYPPYQTPPFLPPIPQPPQTSDEATNTNGNLNSQEMEPKSFAEQLAEVTEKRPLSTHPSYSRNLTLFNTPMRTLPRSLGKDVESEEYLARKLRADRQREYAEMIRKQQQEAMQLQRPMSKPRSRPSFQSEDKFRQSKRFAALQYAQTISKPVLTRRELHPTTPGSSGEDLSRANASAIDMMRIRHEEEKRAIDRMRHHLERRITYMQMNK